MIKFSPNVVFRCFGITYVVDCINGGMVRFHNLDDVYDVGELPVSTLNDRLVNNRLSIYGVIMNER